MRIVGTEDESVCSKHGLDFDLIEMCMYMVITKLAFGVTCPKNFFFRAVIPLSQPVSTTVFASPPFSSHLQNKIYKGDGARIMFEMPSASMLAQSPF